jgi:hypothetical protein
VSSVGPYRFHTSRTCPSAYSPRARSPRSGSPTRFTVRTERGIPPVRSSSAAAVGTALSSVTRSRAGCSGRASASSASTRAPPTASGWKISKTEMSKPADPAARTPADFSAGKTPRHQRSRAAALRCSTSTPLGTPVEPEV